MMSPRFAARPINGRDVRKGIKNAAFEQAAHDEAVQKRWARTAVGNHAAIQLKVVTTYARKLRPAT
jgi:hypothetical protein